MHNSSFTLTGKWTLDQAYTQKITVKYEYKDNNDGKHVPNGVSALSGEHTVKEVTKQVTGEVSSSNNNSNIIIKTEAKPKTAATEHTITASVIQHRAEQYKCRMVRTR